MYVCVCVYVYIYIYIYIYIYTCIYSDIIPPHPTPILYTHIYYTHAYTQTHTHTGGTGERSEHSLPANTETDRQSFGSPNLCVRGSVCVSMCE